MAGVGHGKMQMLVPLDAGHLQALLEQKDAGPLSFIVFIPDWTDPATPGLLKMHVCVLLFVSL